MNILNKALALAAVIVATTASAQTTTTFYNTGTLQKIEISFTQPDWDYQMDTAKIGAQGYIMAQWVKVNGIEYDSVGVKYKGNSSYDSTSLKNPLHINLKKYKSQSYQGLTDIKLANGYKDPSMIREPLSYNMLANYMDCSRSNFAQVYINGSYIGLYSNDEDIDKVYVTNRFGTYSANVNPFFKCSHDDPSSTSRDNLAYLTADSSDYFSRYELESNVGWKALVGLCDTVTNHPDSLANSMDMDRAIWMLAFNNVMVNLDSYSGLLSQNYYLFKDATGRFNPIMWDFNLSLGGFPFTGTQSGGTGSLAISDMEQLSPTLHATDDEWPLIKAVMSNATWKRMYIAHMRTITAEMITAGVYGTTAAQMQATVDTAVLAEPNNASTYSQFQGGMTTNYSVGNYQVPGIATLMNARATYLSTTPEFTAAPPVIANIAPLAATVGAGATVAITATVTGTTTAVYLGYRTGKYNKFTHAAMYDDGAHSDGAAGDGIYGTSVTMGADSMQYYIYAENIDAGVFAPARAEHEFYLLNAPTAISNVATINATLTVYPNPAHNAIHVSLAGSNAQPIQVRNAIGQTVYSGTITNSTTITTATWPAGIYYLQTGNSQQKVSIF